MDKTPDTHEPFAYRETLKHLREVETGSAKGRHFELTETHLLYLDDAHNYTAMKESGGDYSKGFHKEIPELMRRYGRQLLKSPRLTSLGGHSPQLELVDLGPGEKAEIRWVADAAIKKGINVLYVPRDVSASFLNSCVRDYQTIYAPPDRLRKHPSQGRFEELYWEYLHKEVGLQSPMIQLGPTYMNFKPDVSNELLAQMMPAERGIAIVASELLTPTNSGEKIAASYNTQECRKVAFGPLKNLGCDPLHFYEGRIEYNGLDNRVEAQFDCRVPDQQFLPGDTITTLVTYRTTIDDLDANLARTFPYRDIHISRSGHTAVAFCGL